MKKKIKVDTNIWLSFLITANFNELKSLLNSEDVEFIISNKLIAEINEVLLRPKFSKYFTIEKINKFIDF